MMDGRPLQQFFFIFCSLGLLILSQSPAQAVSLPSGRCEFNGTQYDNNAIIPNLCTTITCVDGTWINNGYFNNKCATCVVSNDPQFITFDGVYYNFHGACNYSLTQYEFNSNAPFGIYGKFSPCADVWNWIFRPRFPRQVFSEPSCSDITTFTDNPHTVIVLDIHESTKIWVNDEEVPLTFSPQVVVTSSGPHPVFAWTDGICVTIVGSQGLTLIKCRFALTFIIAHPDLQGTINGLCGHYNHFAINDFVGRSMNVHPLERFPFEFPVSWTTNDTECSNLVSPNGTSPNNTTPTAIAGRRKRQISAGPGENPCTLPTDAFEQRCNEAFGGLANGNPTIDEIVNNNIVSCIADICMMEMIGVVPEEIDEWFDVMNDIVMTSISIAERTTPDAQPIPETEEHSHGDVIVDVLQEVILQ